MRTCPSCGFENPDDADFCGRCSEYLAWEATGAVRPTTPAAPPEQPVAETPVSEPPATEAEGGAQVLVTLRRPDGEDRAGVAPTVAVAPGAEAGVIGLVRNQSSIVDNYDIRVEGLPEAWWTVAPQMLYLLPFGAQEGSSEQETAVTVRPPRAPEAEARAWPFSLVAASRSRPDVVGRAFATLVVEPYHELTAEIRPHRASAERGARFTVTVQNRGNATADVALQGEDSEAALRLVFQPPRLQVGPGDAASAQLDVDAGAKRTGPDRELAIMVRAVAEAGAGDTAAQARASFVHVGRAPRQVATRGRLVFLRVLLTLIAAALLIGGSFTTWTTEGEAVCSDGSADGCLDYAAAANDVVDSDVVPEPPGDLPGVFYFVTSAGFVTIVLGVLALLGLRRGRATWFAGFLAVVALLVLAIRADPESGIAVPLMGGVLALVAGFLPVFHRE